MCNHATMEHILTNHCQLNQDLVNSIVEFIKPTRMSHDMMLEIVFQFALRRLRKIEEDTKRHFHNLTAHHPHGSGSIYTEMLDMFDMQDEFQYYCLWFEESVKTSMPLSMCELRFYIRLFRLFGKSYPFYRERLECIYDDWKNLSSLLDY